MQPAIDNPEAAKRPAIGNPEDEKLPATAASPVIYVNSHKLGRVTRTWAIGNQRPRKDRATGNPEANAISPPLCPVPGDFSTLGCQLPVTLQPLVADCRAFAAFGLPIARPFLEVWLPFA